MSALPIFAFILAFIVFITIIIIKLISESQLKKLDVIQNAPIVHIGKSRSKFTNGYFEGLLKSQKPCKNNCTRIEFYPLDFEQGEGKKLPGIQAVIVRNEFVKRMAKGELSSYREIVKCTDRFLADLPEKMRDTDEGKEMSKEGQKAFLENIYGKFVREGDEALHEAIRDNSRIGMTKLNLAKIKEETNLIRKLVAEKETQKENRT